MEPDTIFIQHKPRPLQKMFTDIPVRYDLMNRLLTFRLDERWRKKATALCVSGSVGKIMDLCTGTGDFALHIARKLNGTGQVYAVDYSKPMLDIAQGKYTRSLSGNIIFREADAASLPFPDEYFDVIAISFAFRNLTYKNPDRDRFLAEISRVLSKTGRFVIVETSQPEWKLLRWFFHKYLVIFVAGIGGWLSGNKAAYHYLGASAKYFYSPGQLKQLLQEAGFTTASHKPLLGGIAAITVAEKKFLPKIFIG
jgi:demethylmenaquinone methyltransferase/2-methoxy-6-polyprenyl-1,4-benzoquinol methylase